MTREDKTVERIFIRYRSIFVFLGFVLIAQLVLALRLALIADNDLTSQKIHLAMQEPYVEPGESQQNIEKNLPETRSRGVDYAEKKKTSPSITPLKSVSFGSNCEITGKDAISAINRAKSQYCKDYLANITCQIQSGSLYPKRLPRFCKSEDSTHMRHVGCYQDDKQNRRLPGHYVLLKETNSPRTCVDLCLQSGFPYAGIEYSVECFCGNVKPSNSFILDSAACNMKCPLDSSNDYANSSTCGGYFSIDVYETGVFRDIETNTPSNVDLENESNKLIAQGSKDETTARIVFFLTLNGRALRQVVRLIKSLFHERHYFYIHVDARQDYLFRELLSISYKFPKNVKFMRDRKSTIWGGASLLKILLFGMNELVKNGEEWGWHWDYVLNLSESDFPLKTVSQLENFLTLNKGQNFLKSHGRDVQNFILKQGLDKTFVECEYRMWRIGDRKLPSGILVDGGSDWIALHYDFVKYVLTTDDDLVNGLLTIFEHTLLPAESFFHIVLRNSGMCHTFVDNNLHVTNWKRKLGCKCQYKNIVDWCGCSPNDFRLSDWNRLEVTQQRLIFFGRKFEAVVSQGIINQLEFLLCPSRFETNAPTYDRYWQSFYHHHDLSPKPDDSVLTLGSSLSRISTKVHFKNIFKILLHEGEQIPSKLLFETKLKEMSVYLQDDRVQGILIGFTIFLEGNVLTSLETWFKLENWVYFEPLSREIEKYHSRIQHIQVGTDYDQKEQIFRNFAGSIGPLSEPTLAYHVYVDEPINITFVWINSFHSVQAVQNFTVEAGVTANFAKPALKLPLAPGNWTVKVLSGDGNLIAWTVFLVSVAEFYHGQPITLAQSKILNVVHSSTENGLDIEDWTPKFLHNGIDEDIKGFYQLKDTCVLDSITHDGIHILSKLLNSVEHKMFQSLETIVQLQGNTCSDSSWSTKFPDPKSSIIGIDGKTGLLLP